jgi:hypothetical protein
MNDPLLHSKTLLRATGRSSRGVCPGMPNSHCIADMSWFIGIGHNHRKTYHFRPNNPLITGEAQLATARASTADSLIQRNPWKWQSVSLIYRQAVGKYRSDFALGESTVFLRWYTYSSFSCWFTSFPSSLGSSPGLPSLTVIAHTPRFFQ